MLEHHSQISHADSFSAFAAQAHIVRKSYAGFISHMESNSWSSFIRASKKSWHKLKRAKQLSDKRIFQYLKYITGKYCKANTMFCQWNKVQLPQLSTDMLVSTKSPHFQIPTAPKSPPSFKTSLVPLVQPHAQHQVPFTSLYLHSLSNLQSALSTRPTDTLSGYRNNKMQQEVPACCWDN